jgi:putative ABC transport system permease protein
MLTSRVEEVVQARHRDQAVSDLVAQLASMPGVESVGLIDDMFINGQGNKSITIPSRARDSVAGELNEGAVSPGLFTTLRVPLVRGRGLTREDVATKIRALWSPVIKDVSLAEKERRAIAEPVVVNEAFVRRFFSGEDPVGKTFCVDPTNKTYWYMIVGVVGDMRRQGLERRAIPEYYGPYLPPPNGRVDLLIRTRRDPLTIALTVRREVLRAIPNVIVAGISTADAQLGDFSAQRRFQTWLLTAFALLAVSLAAVGIYGIVYYAVAERTREIGVRMALGASPGHVLRLVIGQGLRLPVVGILIGLAASIALMRLIAHLLFDVGATDPATFVAAGLVLAAAAAIACYLPARRAALLDPVRALRQD